MRGAMAVVCCEEEWRWVCSTVLEGGEVELLAINGDDSDEYSSGEDEGMKQV